MYLIIYIFILIITNKTTNMNYYAQQLEHVAIDVGVDKTLPQSEFITAKKVIEKFDELKKENNKKLEEIAYALNIWPCELQKLAWSRGGLDGAIIEKINELKKENAELKKK